MKVVLDMDPGIDDAIALLLALNNPEPEVVAVTTVSGNVNVSKATLNALRVIEASGKCTSVYTGAVRPLNKRRRPIHAESVHGTDGLGNSHLAIPRLMAEKTEAVNMLIELLSTHKRKEISIVATGPLTNIAMLLQNEPSAAQALNRIFVMGGIYDALTRGNVTEHAEFNFYSDPEAAEIVMSVADKKSLTVVASGLDITSSPACAIRTNELAMICSIKSRITDLACRILQYPVRTYAYFNLHDVFALFSLAHPEIFKMDRCSVRVSSSGNFRGRCVVASGKGNVLVCKKVNHAKFNEFLLDGLR